MPFSVLEDTMNETERADKNRKDLFEAQILLLKIKTLIDEYIEKRSEVKK